jgi:hypothetical protein
MTTSLGQGRPRHEETLSFKFVKFRVAAGVLTLKLGPRLGYSSRAIRSHLHRDPITEGSLLTDNTMLVS